MEGERSGATFMKSSNLSVPLHHLESGLIMTSAFFCLSDRQDEGGVVGGEVLGQGLHAPVALRSS